MNWSDALLWGFFATTAQTVIEAAARGLGLTRMSIPFLLGTMLTSHRDRASLLGSVVHLVNGWLFALLYALVFERIGARATHWWTGGLLGLSHGLVVLVVLMPLLPGLHPRMASETEGPEAISLLQPPGFLGLNYGWPTSVVTLAAHALYGIILGAWYQPAG